MALWSQLTRKVRVARVQISRRAALKRWLSRRADREPLKRQRDAAQAEAVGTLVAHYLTHLPFDEEQLRMLPKEMVDSVRFRFSLRIALSGSRSPASL